MRHRSVYRIVLPPIVISSAETPQLLKVSRAIRDAVNAVLREVGVEDRDLARVEIKGPRGGWRRVRDQVRVKP